MEDNINKCSHNWKALYYRKKLDGSDQQGWFKVPGFVICDKCEKIVKKEVTLKKIS